MRPRFSASLCGGEGGGGGGGEGSEGLTLSATGEGGGDGRSGMPSSSPSCLSHAEAATVAAGLLRGRPLALAAVAFGAAAVGAAAAAAGATSGPGAVRDGAPCRPNSDFGAPADGWHSVRWSSGCLTLNRLLGRVTATVAGAM